MTDDIVVIERMNDIKRHYGLNDSQLAASCGMSQSSVSLYMNGSRKIAFAFVSSVLEHFEDISAEWLMRGEGEMLKSQNKTKVEEQKPQTISDNTSIRTLDRLRMMARGCVSTKDFEIMIDELKNLG